MLGEGVGFGEADVLEKDRDFDEGGADGGGEEGGPGILDHLSANSMPCLQLLTTYEEQFLQTLEGDVDHVMTEAILRF